MPEEQLQLDDGFATLSRGMEFTPPLKDLATGDRLVVRHNTGEEEDFIIVQEGGKKKVKRVVQHLEIKTGSVSSSSRVTHSLADVDADTEKRALDIYTKFAA
jgi:hypothetical protein